MAESITRWRFPAQDTANAASKIPTILYYDQLGNVMAVGAEAMREGIENEALDGDWVKAEWYVLISLGLNY